MAVFSQQSSVSVVKQITKYSNLVASTFDQIDAWFAVRETELTTSVSQGFYQLKKAIAKKSATVKSPALLKSFKLPSLPQWPKAKATPAKKTTKKQSEKTITITQTSGTLFTQKSRWHKWWPTLREKISSTRSQVRAEINELFNIQPDVSNSSSKSPRRKRRGLRHFKAYLKTIRLSFKPYAIVFRKFPWQTFLSLLVTGFILGGAYGLFTYVFQDLPDPKELSKQEQVLTTKILDRNGQLLFRIYKDENRTLIPLSRLPQHLINATIAIEDKNFYNHHGFSVKGITRAMLANIEGEEYEQGGSTITQQLVKNRLLTPEKTIRRKIREIVLSVLVDGTYTKEEILEMYFNEVAYGGSTYGIEEAAQRYFGKSASQLTLAESALLAGLPQAPSVYSPYGPNPEASYARQEEVLRRMVEDQYITQEQADQAKQEILQFKPDTVDIQAPHFVMYVKQMLAEQYGEELLQEGGLEVRTTLDLELQKQVQKLVTDELNKLARLRINNGAALVTNPQTGEILAMVGSKNYFDFEHDGQVNVVLRPRQPGSSIKPLTYAVAFERGKNPSSVEDDAPITYHIPGSKPYSPKNYDGKFHGRVTLREALGSSYNIPAVKLLAQSGINTVIDKGQEMGITTWQDRQRFGLSLTLGGGEVLMLDLAKVYGTFANQGYTTDINPIMEVKNSKGETLYTNDCAIAQEGCPKRKTLDTRVAYQITDVLKDNNARIPAFGARSVLHIPGQEVAVKTGTTNNLRDNWTFGYTTDRLVAVWVGNNDNTSMSYVASGVTGASPIWNYIMRLLLDDKNPHTFGTPEGLIKVQICARTGTLPCRGCPAVRDEYFTPGTQPTQACNPAQFAPRPKASPQPTDANRDQILQGQSI
ncbi:MAG TPA: PBP1A family penicillin-binding protein [Vitreimonas sp.]|nr:PBP1A family penicillin-binding protein [Vitreimonas sp.]